MVLTFFWCGFEVFWVVSRVLFGWLLRVWEVIKHG